jgi:arsenate reductase
MDFTETAGTFSALGQPTRVQLLRQLAGSPGLAVADLRAKVAVPASTLSFHLAALEQAGLVRGTRRGRQIIYALRNAGLRNLVAFVAETCSAGRSDLGNDLARLLPDSEAERPAPAVTPAFNVLFLCTHNSARSLMAEALMERIGAGRFRAYSAGSEPAAAPLPDVIERLQAFGHNVVRLRCKSWHEFTGPDAPRMDFVIALCDTPQGQKCPEFGDKALTGAWPLPDPVKFTGSPVERAVLLNELYGALRRRLEIFCSLPFASLDRLAIKTRLDEIGDATRPPS